MKATKTWRDMLSKSLSDPNFRKEWEEANAELAELDKIIAARASAGLTQADVAACMGTTQSAVARLESNLMQGIRQARGNFVRLIHKDAHFSS